MGKHKYANDKITVTWDSEVCYHSTVCVNTLAKVFDISKKPWVNVDGATAKEIAAAIDKCPSGALQYELSEESDVNRESENKPMEERITVTISQDGPYLIKGDMELVDHEGNSIETKSNTALCRCGHSSNKPFCDGSHKKHDFKGS